MPYNLFTFTSGKNSITILYIDIHWAKYSVRFVLIYFYSHFKLKFFPHLFRKPSILLSIVMVECAMICICKYKSLFGHSTVITRVFLYGWLGVFGNPIFPSIFTLFNHILSHHILLLRIPAKRSSVVNKSQNLLFLADEWWGKLSHITIDLVRCFMTCLPSCSCLDPSICGTHVTLLSSC